MKTISEVIGTADLFAEIQQIHEFAAFRNVESRDLTAWFLAYHGDRLVQPGISDMSVPQLARMIVHFKQDVIETLTEHAARCFRPCSMTAVLLPLIRMRALQDRPKNSR